MMHRTGLKPWVVFTAVALAASAAEARVVEVEPGEDYRPLIDLLQAGDELVFLPGVHQQFAKLDLRGTAESPIVIRGETGRNGERAEIRWTAHGSNTWEISGEHLQILDLAFHSAHHYGLRIRTGKHITIENCLFRDNGGGDLSANSGDVKALHILNSRFVGGKRTPVYIGSHDGSLQIVDFRFEGNVVDGSQIDHRGVVGYGIQLKLNVDGMICHNYISGTQGPGIMVYGFSDAQTEHRQVVANNIVVGACNSANIVVGGGPATVRNNLCLGGHSGGIAVINYGGRGLLGGIQVNDNIAAANKRNGISVSSDAKRLIAAGNRVFSAARRPNLGRLPKSIDGSDNEAVPIADALLRVIEQLQEIVPSNPVANAAADRVADESPRTQTALLTLLLPLSSK